MPVYEMGRIAAEILLQQIENGIQDVEEVKVKGELVVRDTCGAGEPQKSGLHSEGSISLRRILLKKSPDA